MDGVEERISWLAYDSVTPAVGDTEVSLFAEEIGSSSKTLFDTNMTDAGRFPASDRFRVDSIRLACLPDATVAQLLAMAAGSLEFSVASKPYLQLPLFSLCSGGGLNFQVGDNAVGSGTAAYANFGFPSHGAVPVLSVPIVIDYGQNFDVKIVWPAAPAGSAIKIYVGLDGELTRPIG